MSRLFDGTLSQYLDYASAVFTATPFTVGFWFRSSSVAIAQTLFSVGNSGSAARFQVLAAGNVGGDPIQFAATGQTAFTSTGYLANTWHHAIAVAMSPTDRRVFLDGGGKGTSTVSVVPAGLNRTSIGRRNDSTVGTYMRGEIAEVGVWNVGLTDEEAFYLSRRVSPLLIRPEALVAYWPLWGFGSNEIDLIQGRHVSVVGPVTAEHPSITYLPNVSPIIRKQISGGVTVSGAVSFPGHGTFSPSGRNIAKGAVSFQSGGSLSISGLVKILGSLQLPSRGIFSPAAKNISLAGISFQSNGQLSVNSQVQVHGTVSLNSRGELLVTSSGLVRGSVQFPSQGQLTASGSRVVIGAVNLSSIPEAVFNSLVQVHGAVTLGTSGILTSESVLVIVGEVAFESQGLLSLNIARLFILNTDLRTLETVYALDPVEFLHELKVN